MKKRIVEISDDARLDLLGIYDWIAGAGSPDTALGYIERIEIYCKGFDLASERGATRDDIRQGLRIVGFAGVLWWSGLGNNAHQLAAFICFMP